MKQEMDENGLDQMAEALQQSTPAHNPPPPQSNRWQTDGTCNKKPLDPEYFTQYYQKNYQIKTLPMSGLRTNHIVKIKPIKAPPLKNLYHQQTTLIPKRATTPTLNLSSKTI